MINSYETVLMDKPSILPTHTVLCAIQTQTLCYGLTESKLYEST